MENKQLPQERYYRTKPVREFDLNQTLYNTIFEQNKNNMNVDAIGFLGSSCTYAELKQNVDRLADAYIKAGVREGDTVSIATISMPIAQENLLALSKIGATSKWIDLRCKKNDLINKINESECKIMVIFDGITPMVEDIINETDIEKVVVASPKDYLNPIIKVLATLKDKKEGKQIVLPEDKRFVRYNEFMKTGDKSSIIKPVGFEKERPSIIVQSSGSTGVSKSIIHTEYNFNASMQRHAYTDLPFEVGKTLYSSIPPFIIYGLCGSLYMALAFGMKAEMTPYVSENTLFDDLGKYDFGAAAPIHYRYIYNKIIELQDKINILSKEESSLSKKELSKCLNELSTIMKNLSRVKCFVSGGDKITEQELSDMQHLFATPILNGYGNNELTGGVVISPLYAGKSSSVGVPMKGITIAAFDVNTGERLDDGLEGEICVNSDHVFSGYLNNEDETKRIKKVHNDGKEWIHTGDLGYVDKDGYVYITGRAKRMIKREAFKIAPDTIENVIMDMSEVKDCVVVGVPDLEHEGSSVPMAYVELYPEFTQNFEIVKQKIEDKCNQELPDYEIPKYIENIDKIPYHNTKHAFKELEEKGKKYVESLLENKDEYTKKSK